MFVDTRGLVCNILSLEWSRNVILFRPRPLCAFACLVTYLIISFAGLCVGGLGSAVLLVCLGAVQLVLIY